MDAEAIGKRLEECMRAKGYNTKTFSEALGISERTLKEYFRGKRLPKIRRWEQIVRLLRVKLDYLLCLTDETVDKVNK